MHVVRGLRIFPRTVGLPIDDYIDLRGGDPAAVYARDVQLGPKIQRAHGLAQQVGGHSRVDESAEIHISADAGETLDVRNAHETARPPDFFSRTAEDVRNPSS